MIAEYNGKSLYDDALLFFYASYSSNCNLHLDALKRIERENPSLQIIKINVSRYVELKKKYFINKIPTFIILNNGNIIARLDGYKDQYSISKWVLNNRS